MFVSFTAGGATYFVNCTSDPAVCRENNVTGFPTLSVFRGFGWLGSEQCVKAQRDALSPAYTRIDYHGVLLVSIRTRFAVPNLTRNSLLEF